MEQVEYLYYSEIANELFTLKVRPSKKMESEELILQVIDKSKVLMTLEHIYYIGEL